MSVRSHVWKIALGFIVKPHLKNDKRNVRHSERRVDYCPPKPIPKFAKYSVHWIRGFPIYEFTRRTSTNPKKGLIFIHGGGYTEEIAPPQWWAIVNLLRRADVKIMVPIYPLAKPNYSSTNDNMILMRDVYKILLKEFSPQDLLIVGDSAGGGMTLAFAQYLKSKKIKHPGNIVLISPWIDLTNSNQQVMAASKKDIYLPYEGLIRASKWYCQNNNPKHWKYSPIYGDMKDIGYISIFTSSGDCLSHDANKLDALLWRQKIDHHFSAVPGLFHDYAVFPIPEARPVWKYIASIINDK